MGLLFSLGRDRIVFSLFSLAIYPRGRDDREKLVPERDSSVNKTQRNVSL